MNRQIELKLLNNTYTVKYPNTGEAMDIEILKLQISNNKYDTLKFSFNPLFQKQALIIDTVSTFNTLIPKLRADLNVKSMFDLEQDQMDIIVQAYNEQFLPWYEEIETTLAKPQAKDTDVKHKDEK